MKTIILLRGIFLPLIFIFLACTGCEEEKDPHPWELKLGEDQNTIDNTLRDLEFKFFLKDEKNKPGKIFEQGENFYFHFSVKNISNRDIIINIPIVNVDFFHVYENTEDGMVDMGTPIQGVWCEYRLRLVEVIELKPGNDIIIKNPWILDSTDRITDYYPFCSKHNNPPLLKGKYYTRFPVKISYSTKGSNQADTLKLTFKINFQIQ